MTIELGIDFELKRIGSVKKVFLILLMVVLSLIAGSGCWDKSELKTLALMAGMGVDRTADGKYITTFQIIIPSMVKGGGSGSKGPGGGGGGGMAPAVFITSGGSVTAFGAGRANRFWMSRNLYLPTSQVVVFGQEAARQGMHSAYDLYARYPQKRLTEMAVVAKGTAVEILQAQNQIDKIPAIALATEINDSYTWTGQVVATRSIDLFKYLISKTRAAVMPQVEVMTMAEGEKILKMSGTAVIRKDRLVGELDKNETRGLLWVQGKVKRALLEITDKSGKGLASLEVTKARGEFKPEIRGNQVTIRINVNAQANLVDLLVNENWSTSDKMRELGKMGSAIIRREIMACWKKARSLDADIYGFGEAVNRKHPKEWKSMKNNWDRIFPQIKLEIKVETNVFGSGELIKPPLPQ
jgi:spore germination protein KC